MDNSVVFLGGTCNDDPWREVVMKGLDERKVPYFNPVVEDWNEEAQKREETVKNDANNIQLFVITSKMTGVFSIAEVVTAAHKNPGRTALGICKDGFDEGQLKSLLAVARLVNNLRTAGVIVDERSRVLPEVAGLAARTWQRKQHADTPGNRDELRVVRQMKHDGVIFIPKTDYKLLEDMMNKVGRIRTEKQGCNYEHMMLQPLGAMYGWQSPATDAVMMEQLHRPDFKKQGAEADAPADD